MHELASVQRPVWLDCYTSLRTEEGDYYQVPNNMFFQKIFRCREGRTRVPLGEQFLESEPVE